MFAPKRTAAEPIHLFRAHVSLALAVAAGVGFLAAATLGAGARARRDAAAERAELYYREHPYLSAPFELMLALEEDDAPTFDAAAELGRETLAAEQAELDGLLAEAEAAERELPAYRVGLVGGSVAADRLALHWLVHAGWLHLLWNLGLLASAGARLELRLGRARFGALAAGSALAGAAAHLALSAPGGAPLVGFSALTAGVVGAFAVRPGDVAGDPLAPPSQRRRSPLRAAAILAALASALCALLGAHTAVFPPVAQLGGFALGALAMFGFARAGGVADPAGAQLAPELRAAVAKLHAGDAAGALPAIQARLASGADDALAARALGLAVRGRMDAPELLGQAFAAALGGQKRQVAIALWRECASAGAIPDSARAQLRTLAAWLRAAGEPGEARAALLASLADADAPAAAKLARDARRGDPVLALRAAERALAHGALQPAERKALEELAAQARKDARGAGVVVLDAAREAEATAQRAAAAPRPSSPAARAAHRTRGADPELAAGDAGALDLEERWPEPAPVATPELTDPEESAAAPGDAADANRAFFERDAIDLAAPEPDAPALPDPEISGDAALLDALHEALASDGGELTAEDVAAEPALERTAEVTAEDTPEPIPGERSEPPSGWTAAPAPDDDPRAAALERTTVRLAAPASSAPGPDDFAFGEADDSLFEDEKPEPPPPPLRPLRVNAAVPERLAGDAIVLDIAGRGRAKLAYAKIDAVAAAGVKGLSPSGKAVLLIDLVIGFAAGAGELRVVRLRADAFDPRALVEGQASPLAALRALVAELRARTRGVALPRETDAGAAFRIYADLATYEREALGAAPS